ncbi:MAG: flagellar hook-basal body complex protein [Candidatus Eisenbacteria bacterium]|uniref:Flagellar hook protein FlgE n=1 Tax=Eiseniibacteriota bacterium TaxID=2212470 RepID=A0A948RYX7_UNCEI|nr:flagellar hook-basal body complex protein [Candidatus Eisenbacteria bacterium]MBU1950950.1 flagellar hook-basal body complex protein [Candidatus Eisenbacteria bacterium]MBU2692177.1 flagellar hook-basal body complex protein [Candidatus Eisenbacteria bacterium]
MMRSLFSAVSGLSSHVGMLDVIGNNIANVNTVGFKAGRTTFEEALAQTIRSSVGSIGSRGGLNALQMGTGTRLAATDPLFTQGGIEATGVSTDLALEGSGFFVLNAGDQYLYSRAGSFRLDSSGRLVSSTSGLAVQGYTYDPKVQAFGTQFGDLAIPITEMEPARVTSDISIAGNLNSDSQPLGQALQSAVLYHIDGGTVDSTTKLLSLGTGGEALLQDGDTIAISAQVNGTGYSAEVDVSGNTTLADLMSALQSMLNEDPEVSGTTVSLDSQSRIRIDTPASLGTTAAIDALTMRGMGADDNLRIDFGSSLEMETLQEARDPIAVTQDLTIYDSLGEAHTLTIELTRVLGENAVSWTAKVDNGEVRVLQGGSGRIAWNSDGSIQGLSYNPEGDKIPAGIQLDFGNGSTSPVSMNLDVGTQGTFSGLTMLSSETQVIANQDGYSAGEFVDFQFDQNGIIHGLFSNGVQRPIAQVAVARFANPSGLTREGGSLFAFSPNSGSPMVAPPESHGGLTIQPGALEGSNVDLAEQFTQMILAQRGFQASARVLTTTDEILSDVINLKR